MLENGGNATVQDGTDGDSTANECGFAGHGLTTENEVSNSVDGSPYVVGGYWLTKRRDGRSANWMIGRYQGFNRSIVYKSCRTTDLASARKALDEYARTAPLSALPVPPRKAEVVYFIAAETGQIKIGVASNVAARMAAIGTMSPVPLRLLATIGGGQPAEIAYHRRFAAHRLHGEWFAPHPDILAEIERLTGHPQASNHSAGSSGALPA